VRGCPPPFNQPRALPPHPRVYLVLLEHGADTETRDDDSFSKFSPLDLTSRGHLEVVQMLLEHHADVNSSDKNVGYTALHWASMYGQAAIARVLLAKGADVNAKKWDDQTPLHWASNDGVTRVLLEYGADPNARDSDNHTPLHRAMRRESAEAARVLLENGMDANARDSRNQTPLHLASQFGSLDGVRRRSLLQQGADIHARDFEGRTPFQVASAPARRYTFGKYQDVMQLLLEHGAEDHRTR